MHRKTYNLIGWAVFLALLVSSSASFGDRPAWCGKYLAQLEGDKPTATAEVKPRLETMEDLLWAFSSGLVPDPGNAVQLQAFEVYLRTRFGNHVYAGHIKEIVETVVTELKKHPELSKEPFRNQLITTEEHSYPVTESLSNLIKKPIEAAGQARVNLYQIDSNLGYWKRVLNWEEAKPPSNLSIEQKRDFAKAEKERFLARLNQLLPAELKQALADAEGPLNPREKATQLFSKLSEQRAKMLSSGENVTAISRAMVDLIHTVGFQDKEIQKELKSGDGLRRVAALRRAIDERDEFARELGHGPYFEQALRDLKVAAPAGLDSNSAFLKRLAHVEEEVRAKAVVKNPASTQKEIRQLSLMEAPFRSCIGHDCSSHTYLTKALDPNYQYFTLTDSNGYSSGQVTVVLGADSARRKIAFIDKIQNVPHGDMPIMLEGMRRSFEEKGYTLVLPADLGDHFGISTRDETREFIKQQIKTANETLTGFKPTPHLYAFENRYSRADKELSVKPVAPLELPKHVKLSPLQKAYAWGTKELDLPTLAADFLRLKHGSTDEKIRYITAQSAIIAAGLERDPEFEKTIQRWLADTASPFRLKKKVILYRWLEENKELPPLLAHLNSSERIDFMQNALYGEWYRNRIFVDRQRIPALLVQVRSNSKLVDLLCEVLPEEHLVKIKNTLASLDIPDDKALIKIKEILSGSSLQHRDDGT